MLLLTPSLAASPYFVVVKQTIQVLQPFLFGELISEVLDINSEIHGLTMYF